MPIRGERTRSRVRFGVEDEELAGCAGPGGEVGLWLNLSGGGWVGILRCAEPGASEAGVEGRELRVSSSSRGQLEVRFVLETRSGGGTNHVFCLSLGEFPIVLPTR
jgi:hypothetical protein